MMLCALILQKLRSMTEVLMAFESYKFFEQLHKEQMCQYLAKFCEKFK